MHLALYQPDVPQNTGTILRLCACLGIEAHIIAGIANSPNSGLIVTGSNFAIAHREAIIKLAGQYKLPAVYPVRFFVIAGGLISYGPDGIEPHKRAASYVDRILRGEKPADLPVQTPTKYEMVINLRRRRRSASTFPPHCSRAPTR